MADERSQHLGTPGGSAALKAQHLRERRQALQADRSGLGRIAAALFEPEAEKRLRQEERNWSTGADGEQNLAGYLAHRCPEVPMLHDRRAPGTRANIDHIAIAASSVYVIDCKRYRGKIEVPGCLLSRSQPCEHAKPLELRPNAASLAARLAECRPAVLTTALRLLVATDADRRGPDLIR